MKHNWKRRIVCILIPLAVGGLAALLTSGGRGAFDAIMRPPLTPPGWLFPVVWTILYTMMGIASCLVLEADSSGGEKSRAILLYAVQLGLNFLWPILFFGAGWYLAAFLELVLLWLMVLLTCSSFSQVSPAAGKLMIPYLLWVSFAAYLNFTIYLLNTP